jgi:hypothetical protein
LPLTLTEKSKMSAQAQGLVNLLSQLMSPNNQIRTNAEREFETFCEQQPDLMANLLLEIFANTNESVIIRTFTTILLRRTVDKYYSKLSQEYLLNFRSNLLHIWTQEPVPALALKLTHVISQTAFKMQWKELIAEIVGYGNGDDHCATKALVLLEILVDYCPEDVADQSNCQRIGQFLSKFFGYSPEHQYPLCLQSAKTALAVITALETDESRNSFRPGLSFIQTILTRALQLNQENEVKKIIEYYVTIAEAQPLFFKNDFNAIITLMLQICSQGGDHGLDFSIRSIALELIITLSESAPAIVRRSSFVTQIIQTVMKFVMTLECDETEWKQGKYSLQDDDNNDDDEEETMLGAEAIQRLATGLGGKTIADLIFKHVNVAQPDWKYRRGVLVAISRLLEGATKYCNAHLNVIAGLMLQSLQDPSVRVQYESIQTIGRLAALYTDDLATLVDMFLPPLAMMMQDNNNCNRIRGHAASALINLLNPEFLEDNEVLEKYLEPLLQSLVVTLGTKIYEIHSPCLSILG